MSAALFAVLLIGAGPAESASQCRSYATILRDKAGQLDASCPNRPNWVCELNAPWGVKLSSDQARSHARTFDGRAAALESAANDLENAKAVVEITTTAISGLGFSETAKRYEEWGQIMREADQEASAVIISTLVGKAADRGLSKLQDVAGTMGSFGTAQAQATYKRLRNAGIESDALDKLIEAVATAKGKPAKAAAVKKLLEAMKDVRKIAKVPANDPNAGLEIARVLLEMGLKDPKLKFFVDEVRWVTAIVYYDTAGVLTERGIAQLDALEVEQAQRLKTLTERLKTEVDVVKAARTRANNLPACP